MPPIIDGPKSSLFRPLQFRGNVKFSDLQNLGVSDLMSNAVQFAPSGSCVCNGIPFEIADPVFVKDESVTIDFGPISAPWLLFMHTTDHVTTEPNEEGFFPQTRGADRLAENAWHLPLCLCGPIRRES